MFANSRVSEQAGVAKDGDGEQNAPAFAKASARKAPERGWEVMHAFGETFLNTPQLNEPAPGRAQKRASKRRKRHSRNFLSVPETLSY